MDTIIAYSQNEFMNSDHLLGEELISSDENAV